MNISDNGIAFIEVQEGKRLQIYPDTEGNPTIGCGHLIKDGEDFSVGITDEQCIDLLRADLSIAENAVNKYIAYPMTQNMFDAMVSLCFNIGASNFFNSSVHRFLNDGQIEDAAEAFLLWDKQTINGQKVASKALLARRQREMDLFLS